MLNNPLALLLRSSEVATDVIRLLRRPEYVRVHSLALRWRTKAEKYRQRAANIMGKMESGSLATRLRANRATSLMDRADDLDELAAHLLEAWEMVHATNHEEVDDAAA